MNELRVLILEDDPTWQDILKELLAEQLSASYDVAGDYTPAGQLITLNKYDLAIVDLLLCGGAVAPEDESGINLQLLKQLRASQYNRTCGIVVLSAYPNTDRVREALREYDAYDFVEKDKNFNEERFAKTLSAALLSSRLKNAAAASRKRYRVTVRLEQDSVAGAELAGPGRRSTYPASRPVGIQVSDFARRGDNLNTFILNGGADLWRPEARSIGESLYQALANDPQVFGTLRTAKDLAEQSNEVWLEFSGPSATLGVPFELIRESGDYLSFAHVMSRRIDAGTGRNTETFHAFIEDYCKRKQTLRILIVGANSDGRIPAAEEEAKDVVETITRDVVQLGIPVEVTSLVGPQATYDNLTEALMDREYQILHYAGHGRFNDQLPEISGLVVRHEGKLHTIKASDLNLLVRNTRLRLVYLSCCLGARVSANAGHGDFYGVIDSLARADVPIVLGYRWTVADSSAKKLAQSFYGHLWRTLCPGTALLQARREVAIGKGLDDETWASPVLLMQSSLI